MSGTEGSLLVNVPALIALQRSYIAQFHGDADTTATLAFRALAQLHDGEWMLHSAIQGFLAVAEWLRGRLSAAERAFIEHLGVGRRRPAHHLGVGPLFGGLVAARPGPLGRGRPDLPRRPAVAGQHLGISLRPPARGRRAGSVGLSARPGRPSPEPGDRRHLTVPPVGLQPAPGGWSGHLGLDPPGHRRSGRRRGRRERSHAIVAWTAGGVQPGAGPAGPTVVSPR